MALSTLPVCHRDGNTCKSDHEQSRARTTRASQVITSHLSVHLSCHLTSMDGEPPSREGSPVTARAASPNTVSVIMLLPPRGSAKAAAVISPSIAPTAAATAQARFNPGRDRFLRSWYPETSKASPSVHGCAARHEGREKDARGLAQSHRRPRSTQCAHQRLG